MNFPLKRLLPIAALALLVPLSVHAGEGGELYLKHCSLCHGAQGEGASAPALNKDGLLTTVEKAYIEKTISNGRQILGMPSFKGQLTERETGLIAAHVKGWQKGATISAPAHDVAPAATPRGEELFTLCGGCHGLEGEGAMGPPLLDKGLLNSITDMELRRTIMYGRPGTPMKGYLKGMGGLATLDEKEIDQIISYIRHRQQSLK